MINFYRFKYWGGGGEGLLFSFILSVFINQSFHQFHLGLIESQTLYRMPLGFILSQLYNQLELRFYISWASTVMTNLLAKVI